MKYEDIAAALQAAKNEGRDALTEPEGVAILRLMGLRVPHSVTLRTSAAAADYTPFQGDTAVIKIVSSEILHKTEAGGVALVKNDKASIRAAIADMEQRFTRYKVEGYTVNEYIHFEPKLGREIIVGYRFTQDFGPVVSFGPGGIYTEFLAKTFKPGAATLCISAAGSLSRAENEAAVRAALSGNAVRQLLCAGLRNTKPVIDEESLVQLIMAFVDAAPLFARASISELEVNPFAVSDSGQKPELVALDALVKLGDIVSDKSGLCINKHGIIANSAQEIRPTSKIKNLLMPKSAAIIGVSEKSVNNGRIILRNLISNGFDTKRLYVIKDGAAEIEGCVCVPSVSALPEKVDLFVLVIPAAQTPECIAELAQSDKAETVIVIPGGLEEKAGTESIVATMRSALSASRKSAGKGPLLNGGNCLGIRSTAGKYNTLFIPEYKLPMPKGKVAPVAFISQSGAFAICRIAKHPDINAKYIITCGNQMDVTVGDYLEHLENDTDIKLFAVYVEGFKPMDGLKVFDAVRRITKSGRRVIFYRAGRTAAGAAASASHTASIAGDYPVTKALLSQAGAVMVESLEDFDDALTLFAAFANKAVPKKAGGLKLGAISNAGFECVALADNLGSLSMAHFTDATTKKLTEILAAAKIGDIVDAHNPLDVTPMGDDALYNDAFAAILDDANVDVGIAGIVPLTSRMNTLAKGAEHNEDVTQPDALPARYGKLFAQSKKPLVAVVDSGALYDELTSELTKQGIPTFRTADRALKMINMWLG